MCSCMGVCMCGVYVVRCVSIVVCIYIFVYAVCLYCEGVRVRESEDVRE